MKTRIVIAWVLLGVAVAWAASDTPRINLDDPKKPAAPAGKADPNKPAAKPDAKKDDKKKADDKPGKIDGMEIKHGDGYMGLEIKDGVFKLSFYDAKKKPVAPDVARAALRWQPPYQKQPERVMLEATGKVLTSDRTIRPPYQFKLFITLFKTANSDYEATDGSVENLTLDFAQ